MKHAPDACGISLHGKTLSSHKEGAEDTEAILQIFSRGLRALFVSLDFSQ
jgi:hypothetical protein